MIDEFVKRKVNGTLDEVRAEILDNAFSVINPHNTYKYINVIDLDSIDEILDKYKAEIDPQERSDNALDPETEG